MQRTDKVALTDSVLLGQLDSVVKAHSTYAGSQGSIPGAGRKQFSSWPASRLDRHSNGSVHQGSLYHAPYGKIKDPLGSVNMYVFWTLGKNV